MLTPAREMLMRDFKRLHHDPPAGSSGAPYDNNIMLWHGVIFGPDDTPWDGGTFKLTLQFTEDYPNKPPIVRFISRMFHPNRKGKASKKAKPEPSKEEMHAVVVNILKEVDFNTATLSDILRQLGCARVEGDEEEDDIDDVENEFNFEGRVRDSAKLLDSQQHSLARSEAMLHGHGGSHMSYGHNFDSSELHPHVFHNTNNSNTLPQLPLLTNGHMVDDDIPPEQHALVPSTVGVGGGSSSTRIHPLPFSDPSLPVQSRSMDPSKDLAAYGYGSVAWKERMESWKHK